MIDRLSKDYKVDSDKLLKILNEIDKPIDIANDFKKWTEEDKLDAEDFDLNKYPLKLAFDYAWENLAKNIAGRGKKFAKQKSIEILTSFGVINPEQDNNLKFYSDLSFIKEEIVVVEYEKDEDKNITTERIDQAKNNIRNKSDEIKEELEKGTDTADRNKNYTGDRDNILKFINSEKTNYFQKSKENLGKLRGDLKNKVNDYYKLTERFKEIAGYLGRNFAQLRDKLREENQVNKISHYGVVVESVANKYLLALPLNQENKSKEQQTEKELEDSLNLLEDKLKDEKLDFKVKKYPL